MRLIVKSAPFMKTKLSTSTIMFKLTIALLIVYAFSLYRAYILGYAFFINTILMLVVAILTSLLTEIAYAYFTGQKIKQFLNQSFPLVTPLIFVLTLPFNTSLYAIAIACFIGVLFGKLAFGGFGQNIFNPAALARAIIFASFATSFSGDLVTSATPVKR